MVRYNNERNGSDSVRVSVSGIVLRAATIAKKAGKKGICKDTVSAPIEGRKRYFHGFHGELKNYKLILFF